jgi:acyl carrier protein
VSNLETYDLAFVESFSVTTDELAGLEYQSVPAWDSVGHMGLMASLEEAFEVMFEMDDILDFSSYEKGKEILQKYSVQL